MIDFNLLDESKMENFFDGNGTIIGKIFKDDYNRIMQLTINEGCSVGLHKHESSSEIIYVLKGTPKAIIEGKEERLYPGIVHYCKKGHEHTLINDTKEAVQILAIVCNQ